MEQASLAAQRERDLAAIIAEIAASDGLDPPGLDRILRRHPKDGRGFYSKREILRAYRERGSADASFRGPGSGGEDDFVAKLRTCPTRTLSGITPVTVLTRPFPCPGTCIFCPSDVRMPKSYLADEPGCQRAEQNRFDPYLQTWNRLSAYHAMGHATDKVELIVLGGTWSHYPIAYQRGFVAGCLRALNDFGAGVDRRDAIVASHPPVPAPDAGGTYNARIAPLARVAAREEASWEDLEAAQRENETAGARCVGLSLETRPDAVSAEEALRLRRLGATKVQLGLQSLSDAVLLANRRGHDVAASRRAMTCLRAAGFKLQVHWMPNLKGATPESDAEDFGRVFGDAAIRPDELKVYPCSLIETADLMHDWRAGTWKPYAHEALVDLLVGVLERVPAWCRVTRMIRDIPSPDIVTGNRRTNLREEVEARLASRGLATREIRMREVRGEPVDADRLLIREHAYRSAIGRERFIEAVTAEGRLAGFARLTLPDGQGRGPAELAGAALLREVHVYGAQVALGTRSHGEAQHAGLGTRLVRQAESAARTAGFENLAVISAIGTRGWYRKLGFRDGTLYQHRAIAGSVA